MVKLQFVHRDITNLLFFKEINEAFEELKRVVPQVSSDFTKNQDSNSKLTKITTLRLAVNYIAALTKILDQNQSNVLKDNDVILDKRFVNNESVNFDVSVQEMITADVNQPTFSLNCDPINSCEFENILFNHRSSSLCSSDVPSCDSPSTTTETESLESFKSCGGWDFSADESLEVPETFDLILESDESMQLSDDPLF